jgi:hypothetical protein
MACDNIIEETIRLVNEGVTVTLPVTGWSMLPFIVGERDCVVLQKPAQTKVGDVVLAWVDDCKYVVHRVVRIDGEDLFLMGDGNLIAIEHCSAADVKALATHVVDSSAKKHYLYGRWRRLAVKLWYWLLPIRKYLLAIYKRL